MSYLSRIRDRLFYGDTGLADRDWAPARTGNLQAPPNERTAMALPSDVAMILNQQAERQGLGDEWRRSLEGLLALLHVEDTAQARRELAAELNIAGGSPGTHRHDAALYEALMQRLADNGVVAPESFYK